MLRRARPIEGALNQFTMCGWQPSENAVVEGCFDVSEESETVLL